MKSVKLLVFFLILLSSVNLRAQFSPHDPVTPECFSCHTSGIPAAENLDRHDNAISPLFKTVQSGLSAFSALGPPGCNASEIVAAPSDPNTLYSVINYSKIYRSSDGGASWSKIYSDGYRINSIDVGYSDADVLYFGTAGSIHRSEDGGSTWHSSTIIHESSQINCMSIQGDASDENIVHAYGFYFSSGNYTVCYLKSENRGQTWTVYPVKSQNTYLYTENCYFKVDPKSSNNIYIYTYYYDYTISPVFLRSTDGGQNWAEIDVNLNYFSTGGLSRIAVNSEGRLFAHIWNEGIFYSDNRGDSWTQAAGSPGYIYSLNCSESDPNLIAAGYYNGSYLSVDGGLNWEYNTGGLEGSIYSIAICSSTEIIACSNLGIFKSQNSGTSWQMCTGISEAPVKDIAVSQSNPSILYAAVSSSGIFKSINGGSDWERVRVASNITSIAFDPDDPDIAYFTEDG